MGLRPVWRCGNHRLGRCRYSRVASGVPRAQSRRIEAAQRLIEGRDIADFGMIGEERNHVAALAEHIFGKSLQRLLRSDFHENARAGIVQRAQALHELHGRSDLPRQNVQHLRHDVRPRGIKLAVHVGDDGQARRLQMQALQHPPQRLAGRQPQSRCGRHG